MRFLFFDADGTIYWERDDAESAKIVHEQMTFQAVFPIKQEKQILRGMRVECTDGAGVFHVFEIRKVKNNDAQGFQQITGESIAISELTDEFCERHEYTNVTAEAALSPLLTGTGWEIGTVTASNLSSGDISIGNVWNATRTIQGNWNVYILPRIETDAGGITHKYLDIIPAEGTWRGFRMSLDKNVNEPGVTWDDSNLKTALYGFGREKNETPLTFAGVTWAQTAEHPAKPEGQTYIEDPAATLAYGRNGRPRFGFYQNASITDAATLLQKTWETLKTVNVPDVTVTGTITDMYRLGYKDVPIRLHDTAQIEIRPTGVVLQKEIIHYTEDLLDPNQSIVTAGTYIPNIIYINRETARRSGGGRGGASGDSQTPAEYTTENNTVQIKIDSNGLDSLCVGVGAQLNPDGSLVVDEDGYPVFIDSGENLFSRVQKNKTDISLEVTNRQNADNVLDGKFAVEAGKISQIVTAVGANGEVTAASIVTAINNGGSSVAITADHVVITGETGILGKLTTQDVTVRSLTVNNGGANLGNSNVYYNSRSLGLAVDSLAVDSNPPAGKIGFTYTTLGGGSGTINFNIADTAKYQADIGIESTGSWEWNDVAYERTITPNAGTEAVIGLPTITATAGSFGSNNTCTVSVTGPGNHQITSTTVDASGLVGIESTGAWEWNDTVYERTITPNAGTEAVIGLPTITATAGAFDADHICTVTVTGPGDHTITSATVDATSVFNSVTVMSIDGTDRGDPPGNVNPASITATLSNGGSSTKSLYMTEGNWNSSNKKAVNIRVGSDTGNLIGRIWITSKTPSVGTPYINNHAQGYIRAAVNVNGTVYYGSAVKLTNAQISTWGGPI